MSVFIVSLLTAACVSGRSTRKGFSTINILETGTISRCSIHKACWQCNQDPCSRRDNAHETCVWCHVNKTYGVCMSSMDVSKCPTTKTQRIVDTTQKCNAATHNSDSAGAFCDMKAETSLLRISASDVYGKQDDPKMGDRLQLWFNPCTYVTNQSVLHQCGQHGRLEVIETHGSLINCRTFGHSKSLIKQFVEHSTTHGIVLSMGKTHCCSAAGRMGNINVKVNIHRNCHETGRLLEAPLDFSSLYNCSRGDELVFNVFMCYNISSSTSEANSWYIYPSAGGVFFLVVLLVVCAILLYKYGVSVFYCCFVKPYEQLNVEPAPAPADGQRGTDINPDTLSGGASNEGLDADLEHNVSTGESPNPAVDQEPGSVAAHSGNAPAGQETIPGSGRVTGPSNTSASEQNAAEYISKNSHVDPPVADADQQKVDEPPSASTTEHSQVSDTDSSRTSTPVENSECSTTSHSSNESYDKHKRGFLLTSSQVDRSSGSAQTTSESESGLASATDESNRTRGLDVIPVQTIGLLQSSPASRRDDRN